jgi:hypothetical protein
MNIEEISKKLAVIVDEAEQNAVLANDGQWKEKYEWLVSVLQQMREDAKVLYNALKVDGLTVGTIEAEGYLRCANIANDHIKYIEGSYSSDIQSN